MPYKIWCLSFLLLFFFGLQPAVAKQNWQEFAPNWSYQLVDETFHVFKINPKRYQITPFYKKGFQPFTANQSSKALTFPFLLVNAHFFDSNRHPLGLIIHQKKLIQPLRPVSWWAVLLQKTDRSIQILSLSDFKRLKNRRSILHAYQIGPRLVANGQKLKLKANKSYKSAVGVNSRGDFFIVVSQKRVEITKLADFMHKTPKQGGLGCRDAINLDGGSSTQLLAQNSKKTIEFRSFTKVPLFLSITSFKK